MELSLLKIITEAEAIIENARATLDDSSRQLTLVYAEMNAMDAILDKNRIKLSI